MRGGKMTLGERVRQLRQKAGMTQDALAKEIGYSTKTSISKIENNILDINQSTIVALARALKTTPSVIMGWTDIDEKSTPTSELADMLPNENIYKIPVFSTVSAGLGAYACDDIEEFIPIYISNPADVPNTIGIKVKGNSMYPKIEDGDIIIVRKQDSVDSGTVAVVLLDGEEGLVKKVEYGKDWIVLHSFNPEYQDKRFEGAEVQRLRVVGKVMKVVKSL